MKPIQGLAAFTFATLAMNAPAVHSDDGLQAQRQSFIENLVAVNKRSGLVKTISTTNGRTILTLDKELLVANLYPRDLIRWLPTNPTLSLQTKGEILTGDISQSERYEFTESHDGGISAVQSIAFRSLAMTSGSFRFNVDITKLSHVAPNTTSLWSADNVNASAKVDPFHWFSDSVFVSVLAENLVHRTTDENQQPREIRIGEYSTALQMVVFLEPIKAELRRGIPLAKALFSPERNGLSVAINSNANLQYSLRLNNISNHIYKPFFAASKMTLLVKKTGKTNGKTQISIGLDGLDPSTSPKMAILRDIIFENGWMSGELPDSEVINVLSGSVGMFSALNQNPGDLSPVPVGTELNLNNFKFFASRADTQIDGIGSLHIRNDGKIHVSGYLAITARHFKEAVERAKKRIGSNGQLPIVLSVLSKALTGKLEDTIQLDLRFDENGIMLNGTRF